MHHADQIERWLWASGMALLTLGLVFSRPAFHTVGRFVLLQPTATTYESLAQRLPPSSRLAKRYAAMAAALKQGQLTYSYSGDASMSPQLSPAQAVKGGQ